jgi:hypothetical protein
MEEATPIGEHMSLEVFSKTLEFVSNTYGGIQLLMVSGGEPTEHPEIEKILGMLKGWHVILLSNGLFWENDELREMILAHDVMIQVYNDSRYYPRRVAPIDHPKVLYADRINLLTPFGRAKGMPSDRLSPLCFNLRSLCKAIKNFPEVVMQLRANGKMCSPSIDIHGNVIAGESRYCHKVGTVESSFEDILEDILSMSCNKCGLEDNLKDFQKEAIGRVCFTEH